MKLEIVSVDMLRLEDPIFAQFRAEYPGFDDWFRKCQIEYRSAFVYKDMDEDERIVGEAIIKDPSGLDEIKICSFKILDDYQGYGLGTSLLDFTLNTFYDRRRIFITVFKKYNVLIGMLTRRGFTIMEEQTELGELILEKVQDA